MISTPFTYSQWFEQNTGTQGFYNTLFFIDSLYGWVGGYDNNYNFILRTSDGGDSWNAAPINGIVKSIFFTNRDTGFCGTWYNSALRQHYIYKTTDGGVNWTTVYADSLPFLSISFLDSNNGYAVASQFWEGSIIVNSTDGGNSWSRKRFPTGYVFNSIKMLNDSTGYIAGGFPEKVWQTTNGGDEWLLIFERDSSYEYFNSITFSNQSNGFACGSSFYKTSNSGNYWSEIILPTVTYVSVISIADKCWLAVDGGFYSSILYSPDLGVNWIPTFFHPSYISDVFFVNKNIGWACGPGSLLIKTENGGLGNISVPEVPELFYPEDSSSFIPIPVDFYWSEENNSFYKLQISLDEFFNNISIDTLLIGNRFEASLDEYTLYYWRLRGENWVGNSNWSEIRTFSTSKISTDVEDRIIFNKFELSQNYPNLFNPTTKLSYSIIQSGLVTLKIFDVLGTEIETLVNQEKPAGVYELNWNAANLPSGVYFYQLRSGDFVQTKKMILMK